MLVTYHMTLIPLPGVHTNGGYVEIYLQSGAVFTNATCGACFGTHLGALGENEICISSSSRNFIEWVRFHQRCISRLLQQ